MKEKNRNLFKDCCAVDLITLKSFTEMMKKNHNFRVKSYLRRNTRRQTRKKHNNQHKNTQIVIALYTQKRQRLCGFNTQGKHWRVKEKSSYFPRIVCVCLFSLVSSCLYIIAIYINQSKTINHSRHTYTAHPPRPPSLNTNAL